MEDWLIAIIPTIVCGVLVAYISHRFQKQEKKEEEREKARAKNNVLIMKGVSASLALGEATAEAIQTNHWNGEMNDARNYAKGVKRDIENFMIQQGSEHLQ